MMKKIIQYFITYFANDQSVDWTFNINSILNKKMPHVKMIIEQIKFRFVTDRET
jgi:hypothetical protein